jgi:hypothetical protein
MHLTEEITVLDAVTAGGCRTKLAIGKGNVVGKAG